MSVLACVSCEFSGPGESFFDAVLFVCGYVLENLCGSIWGPDSGTQSRDGCASTHCRWTPARPHFVVPKAVSNLGPHVALLWGRRPDGDWAQVEELLGGRLRDPSRNSRSSRSHGALSRACVCACVRESMCVRLRLGVRSCGSVCVYASVCFLVQLRRCICDLSRVA